MAGVAIISNAVAEQIDFHVSIRMRRNIVAHLSVYPGMAMNTGITHGPAAVINITPMIDILLVLLIVFMAIAPAKTMGLDALMPQPEQSGAQQAPENPVVLEIAADGSYRLNTTSIEAPALADRLTAIYSRRADRVLFVKADPQLEFHTVAEAIDTARGASVDRVALMPRQATSSPEPPEPGPRRLPDRRTSSVSRNPPRALQRGSLSACV